MSLHKLTAGSGYDYLTRQVAALDSTEKGHIGLASYYSERGEQPGQWVGSGMAGIDGLAAGDAVTAEQMRALLGAGMHPLATIRQQQLQRVAAGGQGPGLSAGDLQAVARLGIAFPVSNNEVSPFRLEVAKRIGRGKEAAGLPSDRPVTPEERARIRTEVGREFFRAEHGRDPVDAREVAGQIAKGTRPRTQAVSGYDLTFSPVKSVSTLWAVADPKVAAVIERAHQAAVHDALTFIEEHALFTRTGAQGVRQVDVRGLVAAAFTHRDSRAGDPDLHTHVAVANKVQTLDARWLSIDGRVLFKAKVAASETYNTALESHLRDTLGVRFAERPGTDPTKRPIREIVGVDPALNRRWSRRRASIEVRRGELAINFQRKHGRPPTPVEALHLAQQATLETRDAKHEPRSLAVQRATWHDDAVQVLGSEHRLRQMLTRALNPGGVADPVIDSAWMAATAGRVLAEMEQRRSTWQVWHVRAEAQRLVRAADLATGQGERLVDLLVGEVLGRSVKLASPDDGIVEPHVLRRRDGSSVYTVAGGDQYTSQRILVAEQRLVATAGRHDGAVVDESAVDLALLEMTANRTPLDVGQAAMVRQMATSGARLQLATAPAGAGKTTAMQALNLAWTQGGGTVVGLAPSAAAAAVLAEQTGIPAETLAKLTWHLQHGDLPDWVDRIGPSTLLVIDEAGMADTLTLDTAVQFVVGRGGSVRLVGDDQQLGAIGAGGVLRDIQNQHGAVRLTELHRFTNPAEAEASLALRDGQPEALGFYLDHHRVHVGDLTTATGDLFTGWQTDRSQGLDSIMLAPTRELVAELNQRARTHRLTGNETGSAVRLADGNQASVGDAVITRTNDRRLRLGKDWVKNGDRWTITAVTRDGGLTVRHRHSHRTTHLPADYVSTSTGLGYATTIHATQGVTADTMHGLACGQETRQQLYTMLTRGRTANHLYLQVVGDGDQHSLIRPETMSPRTPTEILEQILARDDTPTSATTLLCDLTEPATRLFEAVQRYTDSLRAAAQHTLGAQVVEALDRYADRVVSGLTEEPAWPTLRAHLLTLAAATGEHPLLQLQTAASWRQVDTATDKAAVLDWRLEEPRLHTGGPLPWLPRIPASLHNHPQWGPYLTRRAQLVTDLAQQVHDQAIKDNAEPVWSTPNGRPINSVTLGDVAVWRATTGVSPRDRRPTGPEQLQTTANLWQRSLDQQVQESVDETPENSSQRSRTGSRRPTLDRHQRDHYRPDRSAPFGRSR